MKLGKFNDQQFQKLKQGFQTGAKSLGVMGEKAFQGIRTHLAKQPTGLALQGRFKEAGQKIASDFMSLGRRNPQQMLGDVTNFMGAGTVKGLATKEARDVLKDSVYNGLKKLKFPATMKNPIEHFETQMNLMGKIEKGTHTADDLRSGSELIKLMESKK